MIFVNIMKLPRHHLEKQDINNLMHIVKYSIAIFKVLSDSTNLPSAQKIGY